MCRSSAMRSRQHSRWRGTRSRSLVCPARGVCLGCVLRRDPRRRAGRLASAPAEGCSPPSDQTRGPKDAMALDLIPRVLLGHPVVRGPALRPTTGIGTIGALLSSLRYPTVPTLWTADRIGIEVASLDYPVRSAHHRSRSAPLGICGPWGVPVSRKRGGGALAGSSAT
jgi:hypothetical protein